MSSVGSRMLSSFFLTSTYLRIGVDLDTQFALSYYWAMLLALLLGCQTTTKAKKKNRFGELHHGRLVRIHWMTG